MNPSPARDGGSPSSVRFSVECTLCGNRVLDEPRWFESIEPLRRHLRSCHTDVDMPPSIGGMLEYFGVVGARVPEHRRISVAASTKAAARPGLDDAVARRAASAPR
jgi:hypothetical protein